MFLTIHGHFYQPPRENPWTGRIGLQKNASPFHDWNRRIAAECYVPNAHSRVLDADGRIEEIINNYDWIHFDFGPTLLRWLEREEPDLYREIIEADARSLLRFAGHGNAIAQAYNHTILPLSNLRDKRTQILWGLRDFEHRFQRSSESIWLPETAIDAETVEVLSTFDIRYLILSPRQASRIRPLAGGRWTDVSDGRIDPRKPYRLFVNGSEGSSKKSIDIFFYDGAVSGEISFDHLLRNASQLADRLERAAQGAPDDAIIHAATDGEIYGHHEAFGNMCLAYLIAREGPRRGIRMTNYGHYLDSNPPEYEVELDFGEAEKGSSWSCMHGVGRWEEDCGCQTGGQSDWNQKWRAPLRAGLDHLRDRLSEIFMARLDGPVRDPYAARDDYIGILLNPGYREEFLAKHAPRVATEDDRRAIWRLLESQHQAMLMFTSCAWFFADISGLEVRQNLAYAARAIDLARPYARVDIEAELLEILATAKSNIPEMGTGADVWRRFVVPMHRSPAIIAMESFGLAAVGVGYEPRQVPAFTVEIGGPTGNFRDGAAQARVVVLDLATDEQSTFSVEARRDPDRRMVLTTWPEDAGKSVQPLEHSIDELAPEVHSRIAQALLAEPVAREGGRIDEIFEASIPMLERHLDGRGIVPPVFEAIAVDSLTRLSGRIANDLARISPKARTGKKILEATSDLNSLAKRIGIEPPHGPIASVIEDALSANLNDPRRVSEDDAYRSIGLLQAAGSAGIKIDRTKLEENVYALLSNHRAALAARVTGRPAPEAGMDPDVLAQLAKFSNLSLRTFERTQTHA